MTDSTLPQPRPSISALPVYVPGARPKGRKMWKMSSNENTVAPSAAVVAAMTAAAPTSNRYGEMHADTLVAKLAAWIGVKPENVTVGDGSVALLQHTLSAYAQDGDEVIYPWLSFEGYPIITGVSGADQIRVPLTEAARHDIPAIIDAVTERTKIILLCSPNNPTGPALRESEVRAVMDAVPSSVLVLLDEAYVDYVTVPDGADGLSLVGDYPNLVVLRTFSKAWGLAGLRVGYAVGNPEIIAQIRKASILFGTSNVSQAAAIEILDHEDEIRAAVDALVPERERMVAAARELGYDVPEAQGNFIWLPVGDRTAEMAAAFLEAGIIVRPLPGKGVRITIAEPEANDEVIAFLKTWK